MLQALCDHLGVHDTNAPRTETVRDLASENGRRHIGIVSRFEHGWGFIESAELGRNFFVHYRDVEGTGLRLLEAGGEVSFEIGPGKDGRPKAVRVQHEGTDRTLSGQPPLEAVSTTVTSRAEGSPAVGAGGEEADDTLQPESSVMLSSRAPASRTSSRHFRLGVARDAVEESERLLATSELHGNELGLARIERIARSLREFLILCQKYRALVRAPLTDTRAVSADRHDQHPSRTTVTAAPSEWR